MSDLIERMDSNDSRVWDCCGRMSNTRMGGQHDEVLWRKGMQCGSSRMGGITTKRKVMMEAVMRPSSNAQNSRKKWSTKMP